MSERNSPDDPEKQSSSARSGQSLRKIIPNAYLRSALIPIFVIEVALIVVYFGISYFITSKNEEIHTKNLANSREVLLAEIRQVIPEIVSGHSRKVNLELHAVSTSMKLLQKENTRFFEAPSRFRIPGSEPKFAFAPNGVFYKTNQEGCSLFYASNTRITVAERSKARDTETFDPLYALAIQSNPIIVAAYFNSWDNMNRLCPFIPKVYEQYPAEIKMTNYNFYYLADAAHDPKREPAWTGAYLDPAGQGWMVSCVAPIYRGDFMEGVTGLDVTIEKMVQQVLNLRMPWEASAILVDADGVILAMPEAVEKILGLRELKQHTYSQTVSKEVVKPEEFNLLKSKDPKVVEQFRQVMTGTDPIYPIRIGEEDFFLAQSAIPETGWRLMALVNRSKVFQPIMQADRLAREQSSQLHVLSRRIGYAAIFVMLAFYVVFFAYLVRKSDRLSDAICQPIGRLTDATGRMGKGEDFALLSMAGIEELDRLSEDFNRLGKELKARTRELVEANIRQKLMEKDAEIAYSAGLFESASAYLHNIGNTLSGIDGNLLKVRAIAQISDEFPEIFRLMRDAHREALEAKGKPDRLPVLLDRLEKLLQAKAFPELKMVLDDISRQHEHMIQTIRHQQATFVSEKRSASSFLQKLDMAELVEGVAAGCKDFFVQSRIELQMDMDRSIHLEGQKNPLIHGLFNLFKNACESIELSSSPERKISISLQRLKGDGARAEIRVSDTGGGIPPENMPKLFRAGFTTKPNGHGLGLHSFCTFLNENSGSIRAESDGLGQGAVFIVEIPYEPKNPDR